MRFFGKKSVSSALGICLAIAWYVGIVLMTASLCIITLHTLMDERKLLEVLGPTPGLSFNVASEYLTIKLPATAFKNRPVITGYMVAVSVNIGFGLAVIFQLRRIFSSLRAGIVFKEESARRIRMIGILTLVAALIKGGLYGLIGCLVVKDISLAGATVSASFNVRLETIFTGLVLLVLGEIFRHGALLQAEQDLTV